jgi:predicted nuclease of predicted toxin-antitoxin system
VLCGGLFVYGSGGLVTPSTSLKILADANVEHGIVRWLRASEYDVVWASEMDPGLTDSVIMTQAYDQRRVILTHDRDFGELVFRGKFPSWGIALMRFSARGEKERVLLLQSWWPSALSMLEEGKFVVIADNAIRSRPFPE